MKSITTSSPTRGICTPPKPWPAQALDTRTQQELVSSPFACRSQWNFTFIRPYLSVQMLSPCGPTTFAVCGPWVFGHAVTGAGRNTTDEGMTVKSVRCTVSPSEPLA
ncbi:hypothetical protein EDP2_2594 [Enterobacter cloacae S611]|uniref:Uncharacterized protein n=1 Tax=Enterobacter cloacae S611 TaxID=1399146 RepID=A0ABN0Q7V7_ENTCL|nr:hypothetical protein EDP2_2594 [Enterobacter cloacae S611]